MATYSYDELDDMYDDMLDEVYGEPMGYPASRILKEVDPIAYRVGKSDYIDSLVSDGTLYELDNGDYSDEAPAGDDEDEN